MTVEGEQRRARLGEAAVEAARREGTDAPPPGAALYDSLAVLFAGLRRSPSPAPAADAPEPSRRDDVA